MASGWSPWERAVSHHAFPSKKCDVLQPSQRHLLITFTLWKWSRVQVRAVEEKTVKKGNAGEFFPPGVKQGGKLDTATYI